MLEELADKTVIVLLAYIAAFLPWTAVGAIDFINSTWRTVRIIRRDAMHNLFFALVPAAYIVFYIILQARSGDFKEMFAAVVALIFALLNAAQTLSALLQMRQYRLWVLRTVAYLRAVGIICESTVKLTSSPTSSLYNSNSSSIRSGNGTSKHENVSELVETMLINDTIIDNQLLHGPSHLSFEYSQMKYEVPTTSVNRGFFFPRLLLGFNICALPFVVVFDVLRRVVAKKPIPRVRLRPHRPLDVWLTWSVSFAAQILHQWTQNFRVAEDPDRPPMDSGNNDQNASPLEKYYARRAYFARRVLASAALHLWRPSVKNSSTAQPPPSPMLSPVWPVSSSIAMGLVSKHDLLSYALANDSIFPFRYPQCADDTFTPNVRRRFAWRGYRPDTRKIQRVADALPVDLAALDDFDSHVLEWFTILLHFGANAVCEDPTLNVLLKDKSFEHDAVSDKTNSSNAPSISFGDKLSEHSVKYGLATTAAATPLHERDVALQNLSAQLGFSSDNQVHSSVDPIDVLEPPALPIGSDCVCIDASHNIVAWRVSELIDVWLALLSGSQLTPVCEGPCVAQEDGKSDTEYATKIDPVNRKATHVCWSDLRSPKGQAELEKRRLERELGRTDPHCWHLSQTLTFMGFTMEVVRSALATSVQYATDHNTRSESWCPLLNFRNLPPYKHTPLIRIGSLSAELAMALFKSGRELLTRRGTQVRLIWEFSEILKKCIMKKNTPSSLEMMFMCILSFPSLAMDLLRHDESDFNGQKCFVSDEQVISRQKSRPSRLSEDWLSEVIIDSTDEQFWLLVEPRGAPQLFSLKVHLILKMDGSSTVRVCLWTKSTDERDKYFDWEIWRDSFLARLQALHDWQKQHDMPCVSLRTTNNNITDKIFESPHFYQGKKETFQVWLGWQPFRDNMCLFELQNPGFKYQQNNSHDVTKVLRRKLMSNEELATNGVSNLVTRETSLPRERLTKSCLLVAGMLTERDTGSLSEGQNTTPSAVASSIIRQARSLVSRSKENISRALLLLESGAIGLSSAEAVFASVQLLTDSKFEQKDPYRAIRTIDEHLELFDKSVGVWRHVPTQDVMCRMMAVYEDGLRQSGYDSRSVLLFCNFAGWMMWIGPQTNFDTAMTTLRRVFLRSRHFSAMYMLAIGKEIQSLHSNTQESSADIAVLCRKYMLRVAEEGGIPLDKDSLTLFEGCLQRDN